MGQHTPAIGPLNPKPGGLERCACLNRGEGGGGGVKPLGSPAIASFLLRANLGGLGSRT